MKQVISIADFATMLKVINDRIDYIKIHTNVWMPFCPDGGEKDIKREKERKLKQDPFYQSLLHAKKALEECKVEIEVPDLEVKDERN